MKFKHLVTAIALSGLALLGLGSPSAMAGTIQFNTTGVFTDTATNTTTSGDSTLIFNGLTSPFVNTTNGILTPIVLGSFTLNTTDLVLDSFGTNFTLTINQTFPIASAGSANATATVTGSVSSAANTTGGTILVFNFSPALVNIPGVGGVTYIPDSFTLVPSGTSTTVNLEGAVITPNGFPNTPLPIASAGAMGLFGIMGLRRQRRA